MVSTDRLSNIKVSQRKYGFEIVDVDPFQNNNNAHTEPLHSTKQVKLTIKKHQQLIEKLELKVEQIEQQIKSQTREERQETSSKEQKVGMKSELDHLKRTIRFHNFSLQIARAAFAQFMITEHNGTIDLSDVVGLAREMYLDEIDVSIEDTDKHVREIFEAMIATFGLYILTAENWKFQFGFLSEEEEIEL